MPGSPGRFPARALHRPLCGWRRVVLVIPVPPALRLLSLGLALLRKLSSLDPAFRLSENCPAPPPPPGLGRKTSLSSDLQLGLVCCRGHHRSVLLSDPKVCTREAQGTDWPSHGPTRRGKRRPACLSGCRGVCGGLGGGGGGGIRAKNGSRRRREVSAGKRASGCGEGPYLGSCF